MIILSKIIPNMLSNDKIILELSDKTQPHMVCNVHRVSSVSETNLEINLKICILNKNPEIIILTRTFSYLVSAECEGDAV